MSAPTLELTLAKLYTDPDFRKAFLNDPNKALAQCKLSEEEHVALLAIDKAGLIMASHSYMHKRQKRKKSLWQRLLGSSKLMRWLLRYTGSWVT
jgi:hypothetical protein